VARSLPRLPPRPGANPRRPDGTRALPNVALLTGRPWFCCGHNWLAHTPAGCTGRYMTPAGPAPCTCLLPCCVHPPAQHSRQGCLHCRCPLLGRAPLAFPANPRLPEVSPPVNATQNLATPTPAPGETASPTPNAPPRASPRQNS
jgi:hypothetical protein